MKVASAGEILLTVCIGLVLALCLLGSALMLVLPTTSLKVDAVYQKF